MSRATASDVHETDGRPNEQDASSQQSTALHTDLELLEQAISHWTTRLWHLSTNALASIRASPRAVRNLLSLLILAHKDHIRAKNAERDFRLRVHHFTEERKAEVGHPDPPASAPDKSHKVYLESMEELHGVLGQAIGRLRAKKDHPKRSSVHLESTGAVVEAIFDLDRCFEEPGELKDRISRSLRRRTLTEALVANMQRDLAFSIIVAIILREARSRGLI